MLRINPADLEAAWLDLRDMVDALFGEGAYKCLGTFAFRRVFVAPDAAPRAEGD